jgi:hypothetical protein
MAINVTKAVLHATLLVAGLAVAFLVLPVWVWWAPAAALPLHAVLKSDDDEE